MATEKYSWEYAILDSAGEPGDRFQLETVWGDYLPGVAMSAAEDFNARPEAAGAAWPLSFVIFSTKGEELGRHTVKRWFMPCFLTTDPEKTKPTFRRLLERIAEGAAP